MIDPESLEKEEGLWISGKIGSGAVMSKQKIRMALKRKQKDGDQEIIDFLADQLGIDIETQAQNILAHPSPAGTR